MRYVIISAIKNEDKFIERTIKSILTQTIQPVKWIIVSDSSGDKTDEIVLSYENKVSFIKLIIIGERRERNFASMALAFLEGIKHVKNIDYEFIGQLDGDITLEPDYYERILKKFKQHPNLGIGGGKVYDLINGSWQKHISSENSVGGMIQLFRRRCYEEIGGLTPIKLGYTDALAQIKARQLGWETKTFPELIVKHYRPTGASKNSLLYAKFARGKKDYSFRYHPLFHLLKCLYRINEKPYFICSVGSLLGYIYAYMKKEPQAIPSDIKKFLRQEQINRIKSLFLKYMR